MLPVIPNNVNFQSMNKADGRAGKYSNEGATCFHFSTKFRKEYHAPLKVRMRMCGTQFRGS